MSADVITKFTYLEYGKHAPKHSSFKGIITTKSIIGFTQYGKRESSKVLSVEAKAIESESNFFDYTNKRLGATKTYSSLGWIDDSKKDLQFRNVIAQAFKKDGDLIWVPVLSLKDFMTSTEMKLFNEEDYAAALNKMLPEWFKRAGFNNENMLWWMDHHVNTDNPHLHICFLEKEKTMLNGKLPMKDINNFKSLFWKEVFSKKRYLEATGKAVDEGFKNKDMLKQETYKSFKEGIKICNDKEFVKLLKDLYDKLPLSGRLQYNSSHMIPYRSEIDNVVNHLLRTPLIKPRYDEFMKSVKVFDEVRSKSMTTQYDSLTKSEDKKLRVLLANTLLKEFKNVDHYFWENRLALDNNKTGDSNRNLQDSTNQIIKTTLIPIANTLILNETENQYSVRLPTNGNFINIDKSSFTMISIEKNFQVAMIQDGDNFMIHNRQGKETGEVLGFSNIHEFFDDGQPYLDSLEQLEKDRELRAELWRQRQMDWAENNHDWNKSSARVLKASFSWMNEIEREVNQVRNEFFNGKDYSI